jgi:hypothetical protein
MMNILSQNVNRVLDGFETKCLKFMASNLHIFVMNTQVSNRRSYAKGFVGFLV